jgi:hypothetical protein
VFSRRNVLAASAAAPFLASSRQPSADDALSACRASLARLFPNSLDHARALGRACGAVVQDAVAPLDGLCRERDHRWIADAPLETLRAEIDAQIRADYAQGRTRRVDGWMLSLTETRLFAILAG